MKIDGNYLWIWLDFEIRVSIDKKINDRVNEMIIIRSSRESYEWCKVRFGGVYWGGGGLELGFVELEVWDVKWG